MKRTTLKGAERLEGPWEDVEVEEGGASGGRALPAVRFFKVEVAVP